MTEMGELICRICGMTREQHIAAEAGQATQHEFSEDGKVVQIDWEKRRKSAEAARKNRNPDFVLRLALINKGILEPGDLQKAAEQMTQPLFGQPPT